jgi:hypothetical protein
VAFASGEASTRLVPGTTIEAKLQAHVVDLVGNGFYPVGPLPGVRYQLSGTIPTASGPAIVDVDVWQLELANIGRKS